MYLTCCFFSPSLSPSLPLTVKVNKYLKNTLKYYLTPVRMATIKKANDKCLQEGGEIGTLVHGWCTMSNVNKSTAAVHG